MPWVSLVGWRGFASKVRLGNPSKVLLKRGSDTRMRGRAEGKSARRRWLRDYEESK